MNSIVKKKEEKKKWLLQYLPTALNLNERATANKAHQNEALSFYQVFLYITAKQNTKTRKKKKKHVQDPS